MRKKGKCSFVFQPFSRIPQAERIVSENKTGIPKDVFTLLVPASGKADSGLPKGRDPGKWPES